MPRSSVLPFSSSCLPMPRLFAVSASSTLVPRSFASLSPSRSLLIPGSSAPSTSGVPMSSSSSPLSSFDCLPVPELSAFSPSGCLRVLELFPPRSSLPFLI